MHNENDQVSFCAQCGTKLTEGTTFCTKCGSAIKLPETLRESKNQNTNKVSSKIETFKLIGIGLIVVILIWFGWIYYSTWKQEIAENSYDKAKISEESKDYTKAIELYEKACELGLAKSCTSLGSLYGIYNHMVENADKAKEFFEKGCEKGDAAGCTGLGGIYSHGDGVEQNFPKSVELFEKGCDGDNMEGCDALGYMILNGFGTDKNKDKAIQLFKQACDGGYELGCERYQNPVEEVPES